MDIKRVWDTTQKKMIWSENSSGKRGQVWKVWDDYVVDNKWQWEQMNNPEIYWPVWEDYPETDNVGYYDTNVPTNIYVPCVVTIVSEDTSKWTVDNSSVIVNSGTAISATSNKLTIWTEVITATAQTGYTFSSWGTLPATVTGDLTITATFA